MTYLADKRIRVLAAASVALACEAGSVFHAACSTNADCPTGQVCFREGCAAPLTGLAIDVTPPSGSTLLEQDQPLSQISSPTYPLTLQANAEITFAVTSAVQPLPAYTISAAGMAFSVPIARSFVISSDGGVATLADGGAATLTVPASPGIYQMELDVSGTSNSPPPPIYQGNVVVHAGAAVPVSFAIPQSCPVQITGSILANSAAPSLPMAVTVQAFDRASVRPISQATTVQPGSSTNPPIQEFQLCIVQPAGPVDIHVSPVQPATTPTSAALMPSKVFPLPNNDFTVYQNLYLGDYGAPLFLQQQVVRSPQAPAPYANQPLVGAQIWVEGTVNGGGTFKSVETTTDAMGNFGVMVLPSATTFGQTNTLTVHIAPEPSTSQTAAVTLRQEAISIASLSTLPVLVCDEKTELYGTVLSPGGASLPNVQVTAVPIDAAGVTETTTTDVSGDFVLRVNPASYAFYFDPGSAAGALIARGYLSARSIAASPTPVVIPAFRMPAAVSVDVQLSPPMGVDPSAVANSNVSVFQIPTHGSSPVLLWQTQADSSGTFRMLLPARTN